MTPQGAFRPSPAVPRQARRIAAFVRDTRVLLREFRWALLFGGVVVLGGAAALSSAYDGPVRPDFFEGAYDMVGILAFQSPLPFPHAWGLRLLFIVTPIVSFAVLAESLVRFGVLFFNHEFPERQPQQHPQLEQLVRPRKILTAQPFRNRRPRHPHFPSNLRLIQPQHTHRIINSRRIERFVHK